ncbi:MAG: hypothetical protein H6607_08170 [Flavobacteriales bacterium]|nr:hypothetical protein [Flavobacteriales bacterium]
MFKLFFRKQNQAFAFYPFIFCRNHDLKVNTHIIRHEKIHHRQQLELLILPFYILYFLEFLFRYAYLKDFDKAYRAISFEKEAYQNDNNANYLKTRKLWSMWRKQ